MKKKELKLNDTATTLLITNVLKIISQVLYHMRIYHAHFKINFCLLKLLSPDVTSQESYTVSFEGPSYFIYTFQRT